MPLDRFGAKALAVCELKDKLLVTLERKFHGPKGSKEEQHLHQDLVNVFLPHFAIKLGQHA